MKKVLCILLTALLVCAASGVCVLAADDGDAAASVSAVTRVPVIGVTMEKGDTFTVNYRDLEDRSNVPIPKSGHLEWYWVSYGGKADFTLSADKKNCTVRAVRGGSFVLGCDVIDASGKTVSSDGLVFEASSPFYRFINTVTLGLYGTVQMSFWRLMSALTLIPLYDIT